MEECASDNGKDCENFEILDKIPAITFRKAKKYWTIMMRVFVSLLTPSLPLGFSTAKPPTPVIEAIMIDG